MAERGRPKPVTRPRLTGSMRIPSTIAGTFSVQSLALREKTRTRSPSRRPRPPTTGAPGYEVP